MRFVFIDMHCNNFLTNTYSQIKGGTKVKTFKHKFLVDYALNNGIEIADFVTGQYSTSMETNLLRRYLGDSFDNKFFTRCIKEAHYVLDENYGKNNGITILESVADITEDDYVFCYIMDKHQKDVIEGIDKGHRIFMGNHFVAINERYDLSEMRCEAFVNEIDMSDNTFANKYLNNIDVPNIICPYVFAPRFVDLGRHRKNKAMAIGTLSTCSGNPGYKLYREEFGTEWIQLMRKEIYEHSEEFPSQLDSYISYILEDKKVIQENDVFLVKKYKKLYNTFSGWTQKKYTSFDMVEKFNEYSLFVCPEELVGMPGIGFVEGMACGTAYIGLDTTYYRKLGLIPGVNYITYDGTLNGLIDTIKIYQEKPEDVKTIAKAGMELVREHFNSEAVAHKFCSDLENI